MVREHKLPSAPILPPCHHHPREGLSETGRRAKTEKGKKKQNTRKKGGTKWKREKKKITAEMKETKKKWKKRRVRIINELAGTERQKEMRLGD